MPCLSCRSMLATSYTQAFTRLCPTRVADCVRWTLRHAWCLSQKWPCLDFFSPPCPRSCSVKSVRVLLGLHIEFFCSVFAGSWTVLLNKTQRSTKILNITLQYCRFTNFYSTLQKVYRIHIVILIVACSTVLDYFAKTNEQTKRFANEKTRNDSQTKRTNTKRIYYHIYVELIFSVQN